MKGIHHLEGQGFAGADTAPDDHSAARLPSPNHPVEEVFAFEPLMRNMLAAEIGGKQNVKRTLPGIEFSPCNHRYFPEPTPLGPSGPPPSPNEGPGQDCQTQGNKETDFRSRHSESSGKTKAISLP